MKNKNNKKKQSKNSKKAATKPQKTKRNTTAKKQPAPKTPSGNISVANTSVKGNKKPTAQIAPKVKKQNNASASKNNQVNKKQQMPKPSNKELTLLGKLQNSKNACESIVDDWVKKLHNAPEKEVAKINKKYAKLYRTADEKREQANKAYFDYVAQLQPNVQPHSSVGEIHRGNTKYIDTEPKLQRDYTVVKDKDGNITVAKVKSIKKLDKDGKNADPALVEINHEKYGLENRSGVDFETFDKNRMSNKPLKLSDKDVFPEQKPRAKLNSKDKHNVLIHTKVINDPKKKKGGNSN